MKLTKFALALTASALLSHYANASTDPVVESFDHAFCNDAYIDSYRTRQDQVAASFDRAFGNEQFVAAYRTHSDEVVASFDRDMIHEPIAMEMTLASAAPMDFINSSLNLGENAVVASFEHDLLGNAMVAITIEDAAMASFINDMYHEPIAVAAAATQGAGDDAFNIGRETNILLTLFYRQLPEVYNHVR